MNRYILLAIALFTATLGYTQGIGSDTTLLDIDIERFYHLSDNMVKNLGLTVTSDKMFEELGLTINEIGFRKKEQPDKSALYIRFHYENDLDLTIGAVLFGNDRNAYWSPKDEGIFAIETASLGSMSFDFDTTLQAASVLTIWVKKSEKRKMEDRKETQFQKHSQWLLPASAAVKTNLTNLPEQDGDIDVYDEWTLKDKPTFRGGNEQKRAFLTDNIKYPTAAVVNNAKGIATVLLIVKADGSIGDVRLVHDVGYGCGEELMRVVEMMPRWIPGKKNGEAVAVRLNISFKFD